MEKKITVTGCATESYPADRVEIRLNAAAEAKKYAESCAAADKLASSAVAAIKAANIDGADIRAQGLSVTEVRDGKKIAAYRATRSYSISFPYEPSSLGAAIDALSNSECTFSLGFSLADESHSRELLASAVKRARAAAEVIASSAGVKAGELVSVSYEPAHRSDFMMMSRMADDEPALITLSESVVCAFAIE